MDAQKVLFTGHQLQPLKHSTGRDSVAVAPANFWLKPELEAAPIRASRAAFSQAAILAGSH